MPPDLRPDLPPNLPPEPGPDPAGTPEPERPRVLEPNPPTPAGPASDRPTGGPVDRAVRSFLAGTVPSGLGLTVACSGGADSLALAAAVIAAAGPDRVAAVTVDHGLQPGSAARAAVTAEQLRGLGYRLVSVATVTVGRDGGPEAAARAARYRALTPAPGDRQAVLLAHTLDDQAETMLLGLARGSGPRSIAGMSPWRPPWGRPLLAVRRQDTESYCRALGLDFWQDPHNSDPAFTRVRLRREVLPLLDDVLGGGVAPALARTAELMAEDLRALDLIAASVLAELMNPAGILDVSDWLRHPPAVRTRVVRAWASAIGAGPLTFDHLRRLDSLARGAPVSPNGPPDPAGPAAPAGGPDRRGAVRLPGAIDAVRVGSTMQARPG